MYFNSLREAELSQYEVIVVGGGVVDVAEFVVFVVIVVEYYCFFIIIVVGPPYFLDTVWLLNQTQFSKSNTNVALV